jgi:predicted MPP superfamily phosphohydrolase
MWQTFVIGLASWSSLALILVGHTYGLVLLLNVLYGLPINKYFLKLYRLFTGLLILALPSTIILMNLMTPPFPLSLDILLATYMFPCLVLGVLFGIITWIRLVRKRSWVIVFESTRTINFWPQLKHAAIGDGYYSWLPRFPLNGVFKVDYTELTLQMQSLPQTWDGLTILLLSDLHFHGTPSFAFFDEAFKVAAEGSTPDLVVLAGDFVDTDEHIQWIAPLLERFKWNEAGLAVLGNHDKYHQPDAVREELDKLGYRVLSNRWDEIRIRGTKCVVVGHEGPWITPGPGSDPRSEDAFTLCVSHTPDNFPWGVRQKIDLMLSGHVHGGGIRIPIIGSIFVPSIYSRRYDMGVFQQGRSVLVVGRGLSGKEPVRFRCNPQILRITLQAVDQPETGPK